MALHLHRTAWLLVLLLWAVASCHDAPRTNPFDPALTPAVELSVALDDTAGTATLTWTPYEGQQPFREYRVLRKQPGLEKVDTLVHISAVEQRSFVDSSLAPYTDYLYRVSVVNSGGFEVPSPEEETRPLNLPRVQLLEAQLDSRTATAALRWTAYRGPRFRAYRLERRSARLAPLAVKEISAPTDTAYVDSLLAGNTEYFYRVVVETERAEELPSQERSGAFHQLLATWSLGAEVQSQGRIYVETGDRIAALVYRKTRPWILSFDPEGRLLEEWTLPAVASITQYGLGSDGVTSLSPEGRRFFGLSVDNDLGILSFGPDGQPLVQERALFTDAFPNLSDTEKVVQGEISLKNGDAFVGGLIDNVRVSADGRELFLENFEEFPEGAVAKQPPHNWELKEGGAVIDQGTLYLSTTVRIVRADETWQNFRLEADEANWDNRSPSIQIGGDAFSRFTLALDVDTQQALLDWVFSPPGGLELQPQGKSLSQPIPIMSGVFYGLSLEAVDGVVRASMKDPMIWKVRNEGAGVSRWSSLALVGDLLAFTRGDQIYHLTQAGEIVSQASVVAPVSEIRVWENPKDGAQWVGVCMPDLDQIQTTKIFASNPSNWPRLVSRGTRVGPELGSAAGALLSPISFAAGPDGRFYALDAGNARIVVFDADKQYLTQWGHKGSGEGDFDFGKGGELGSSVRHFAGSIAVDSEGYIYVLDVFNQRIQKFAP